MLGDFVPVVLLMAVAAVICTAMVTLSWVLGPKRITTYKQSPYECGVAPLGDALERVPIKFYLVAILFVLFDIEVVFLWGFLSVFRNAPIEFKVFAGIDMLVYIGLMVLGLAYALRVRAIEWDEPDSLAPEKLRDTPAFVAARDGLAYHAPAPTTEAALESK